LKALDIIALCLAGLELELEAGAILVSTFVAAYFAALTEVASLTAASLADFEATTILTDFY